MPQYNKTEIERIARQNGFVRDTFEKVFRISKILQFFNSNELLRSHFLLKGGTAINLLIFDMPRLSVDIDMDFIPNLDANETSMIREEIKTIVLNYMSSEGYVLSPSSYFRYSLDSFHFNYVNAGGGSDLIKIELNYSLRSHLFEPEEKVIIKDCFTDNFSVMCVNSMEIFAGKAVALMTRAAARDLYDFVNLINLNLFDKERDLFRKSIIFYSSISSDKIDEEFRTDSINSISKQMIRRDLMPVLRQSERVNFYNLDEKIKLVKEYISELMNLEENERDYLKCFQFKEFKPELLFTDSSIIDRIKEHPMALWRCGEKS